MSDLRFAPIDDGARDGNFHLLRDARQHQFSGQWDGKRFVFSSGAPIPDALCDYAARQG